MLCIISDLFTINIDINLSFQSNTSYELEKNLFSPESGALTNIDRKGTKNRLFLITQITNATVIISVGIRVTLTAEGLCQVSGTEALTRVLSQLEGGG